VPEVYGGALDRAAGSNVDNLQRDSERHSGFALANVRAEPRVVEVVRPLHLLGREDAGQPADRRGDRAATTAPGEHGSPDERVSTSDKIGGVAHLDVSFAFAERQSSVPSAKWCT
jgi:hypothetical protein